MNKLISSVAIVLIISGIVFPASPVEQLSINQEIFLVKKCLQKLQTSLGQKQCSEEAIKEVVDQVVQDQAHEGLPELENNRMKKMVIVLVGAALICGLGCVLYRCIDNENPGQIMMNAARQEAQRCQAEGVRNQHDIAQRIFNAGVDAVSGNYQSQIRNAFPYPPQNDAAVYLGFNRIRNAHTDNNFRFNIFESAHQAQDYYRAMFS